MELIGAVEEPCNQFSCSSRVVVGGRGGGTLEEAFTCGREGVGKDIKALLLSGAARFWNLGIDLLFWGSFGVEEEGRVSSTDVGDGVSLKFQDDGICSLDLSQ